MTALPQTDLDELKLLYQVTAADLAYFKTQQWAVTYYCLLVDAALVGVAQLLHSDFSCAERLVLGVLAFLAAGAALIILRKLEYAITVRHRRLERIRARFGSAFLEAWTAGEKREEYIHSLYILYGGIGLTTALSLWLIAVRL
jgi:hypothetical protein